MVTTSLPPVTVLRQLFIYDAETGNLILKPRLRSSFKASDSDVDRICNAWNSRFSGKIASTVPSARGYLRVTVLGRRVYAHRVIYKIETGEEPEIIDHINGDTTDNRIENLRSVTQELNTKNAKLRTDNITGKPGVYWEKKTGKWRAYLNSGGKRTWLGRFDSLDQALSARERAECGFGFHQNHGRPAR